MRMSRIGMKNEMKSTDTWKKKKRNILVKVRHKMYDA